MQLASAVEVENGVEGARMAVKEISVEIFQRNISGKCKEISDKMSKIYLWKCWRNICEKKNSDSLSMRE